MALRVRPRHASAATGAVLVALGALGLFALLPGGLTRLHDLLHLAPGLVLLVGGLPRRPGLTQVSLAVGAGVYLVVGLGTLVAPARTEALLGIPASANLIHLVLGLALAAVLLEVGPFEADA